MQQIVDQFDLRQKFDSEEVRDKLKMAGLRGQAPLVAYMFFRVAVPVIVFARHAVLSVRDVEVGLSADHQVHDGDRRGFRRLLSAEPVHREHRRRSARRSIKQAFPDSARHAADLRAVGHVGRGGIRQGGARSGGAVDRARRGAVSLTTAELSYLQERRLAFENLGSRTGLPGVKAVATALIQAERYGTPVGQALRVMAKENRDIRMSEAEKKASALPPKLTVPMIVFFLPVLFVVILGPAAIKFWKMA